MCSQKKTTLLLKSIPSIDWLNDTISSPPTPHINSWHPSVGLTKQVVTYTSNKCTCGQVALETFAVPNIVIIDINANFPPVLFWRFALLSPKKFYRYFLPRKIQVLFKCQKWCCINTYGYAAILASLSLSRGISRVQETEPCTPLHFISSEAKIQPQQNKSVPTQPCWGCTLSTTPFISRQCVQHHQEKTRAVFTIWPFPARTRTVTGWIHPTRSLKGASAEDL